MTQEFFHAQMARLVGLRWVPRDMTTHWEALRTLPDAVLDAAVAVAGRTRVDFPTPHELRQDADSVRTAIDVPDDPDRSTALDQPYTVILPHSDTPIRISREWSYHCDYCSDIGWRRWWCGDPPMPLRLVTSDPVALPVPSGRACDRYHPHGSHEWVAPCECAEHNPALIRKRHNQERYAARQLERTHR
jgi:hypothetical protein